MTSSPPIRFAIEDAPSDADVEVLPNGLEAFNESRWPGHQQWQPLAVFARDGESIVAGLAGETYSGWLFIRYLWVSDSLRGRGIGRKLMADAEGRALERGCHSALGRHVQLPGAGLLSQARLSCVRRTGLSARTQALLLAEAARGRDVSCERGTRWGVQFCARLHCFSRLGSLFCNYDAVRPMGR
jgi:GNAT superfamily N-acetyltransferase